DVHLRTHEEQTLADLCFTANVGRAHLPYRAAFVCSSTVEARQRLRALADGAAAGSAHVKRPQRSKVAFVMTGPPRAEGGAELYRTQPTFRRAMDENPSVQQALAELWRSWGVEPDHIVTLNHEDVAASAKLAAEGYEVVRISPADADW